MLTTIDMERFNDWIDDFKAKMGPDERCQWDATYMAAMEQNANERRAETTTAACDDNVSADGRDIAADIGTYSGDKSVECSGPAVYNIRVMMGKNMVPLPLHMKSKPSTPLPSSPMRSI